MFHDVLITEHTANDLQMDPASFTPYTPLNGTASTADLATADAIVAMENFAPCVSTLNSAIICIVSIVHLINHPEKIRPHPYVSLQDSVLICIASIVRLIDIRLVNPTPTLVLTCRDWHSFALLLYSLSSITS